MTRLNDRYELRHVLGRGGMGEVWAARDLRERRDVAVKIVPVPPRAAPGGTETGPSPDAGDAADRLRHEAAVTAAIEHPGVVDIHDTGEDGTTAYLVMDLLPGLDLDRLLRGGPVPATEAVAVAAAVADTLDAAHRAGVVHGDVKPANIVVSDGGVVLIDFGAAAPTGEAGRCVTFGTAPYMAPEQVWAAPATPATDVYALGCLLHAALTGRPPFVGESPMAVLHRHVREQPPRLGELADGVPRDLDEFVARMLAKEPGRRGTVAQARDRLNIVARSGALRHVEPLAAADDVDRLDPQATLPALVMLPAADTALRRAA